MISVLVVDDDRDVLHAASVALGNCANRVVTADATAEIAAMVLVERFDVVLLDMNFALGDQSGREGLSMLAEIREVDPHVSVILMTAYGAVSLAVRALKQGATDFVLKPWRNDALVATVVASGEKSRQRRLQVESFDLEGAEREVIERAIAHHRGNISKAAADLGLTRPALYRRIQKHGL